MLLTRQNSEGVSKALITVESSVWREGIKSGLIRLSCDPMILLYSVSHLVRGPEFPGYAPVNVNVTSLQRRISENFDAARLPTLLSFEIYQATFKFSSLSVYYSLSFVPEIKTDTKTIRLTRG